jgi:hypothetical protein
LTATAKDFVDGWITANIRPVAFEPEDDAVEAKRRAFECWAAAQSAGVDRDAIEADCGSLISYMAAAIERVNTESSRNTNRT